jgi:hypothetical protein
MSPFPQKKKEGPMPRLMKRQEISFPSPEVQGNETWCDGLLVDGIDHAARRRARIRALNTARQLAEQRTARTYQVACRLDADA